MAKVLRSLEVGVAGEDELAVCRAIRSEVFVVGQNVPEALEFDGLDGECTHFLARVDGAVAGTARLRSVGGCAKAERVAVLDRYRGTGIGRALMEALEREAARLGFEEIVLNAQVRVLPFYEKLGYRVTGPLFSEADIPHRPMQKRAPGAS